MAEVFITELQIKHIRHLSYLNINISRSERKHLVLTGKNGSGKTSVLESLRTLLSETQNNPDDYRFPEVNVNLVTLKSDGVNSSLWAGFRAPGMYMKEVVCAYIGARRNKLTIPTAIEPVDLQDKTYINLNASSEFLKYLISLDYRLYGAQADRNDTLKTNLENWFDNFRDALCDIYDCPELQLQRDTKNLTFKIKLPNRESFGLHEMSDGYAAFLDIYMELLMRMESADGIVNYEQSAIVLIDEVEAHLHVELQRRILPFLTKMFHKAQFIVTTHSPFVITSLDNAVVFDLEKQEALENPSMYSFESVVESFLDTSAYSQELIRYFGRYNKSIYMRPRGFCWPCR